MMPRSTTGCTFLIAAAVVLGAATAPLVAIQKRAALAPLDTAAIERAAGAQGTLDPATGVYRIPLPRTDVHVRVGGIDLTPRQGVGGWLAFAPAADGAILMGDLVLLAGEVDDTVSAALDAGLEVTAIHDHFLGESPRLVYVHVDGHAMPDVLATAAGRLLQAMRAARGKTLTTPLAGGGASLDAKALDEALVTHGELADGVYRATFAESTSMHGELLGAPMGVATWAAFGGSGDHAVVDGDFAMRDAEVRPVMIALRQAGISIVALHSHMVGEQPKLTFLHYWGAGKAIDLANGLRAALDAQRRARESANRH